jgi:dipeptidyl aminopeptidase/acylaminoacyl peptidase
VSIAPDFLGYGESASPSADVWEARFETYTTAVNLLAAVDKWPKSDGRVGIWGHSNGGHVALTALEITGRSYPTVLWAPVSAPFPYSVLYYTDDYEDHGKAIRKDLARFEADYDTEQFALVNYLDRVAAPILWQQGTADPDVPIKWSRGTVGRLRGLNKDVEYAEYPGADHNLLPAWQTAVEKDIEFYSQEWK